MMRMQARESQAPIFGERHPLRQYANNSPRAQARLIVLALLADGHLDEHELDALDQRGILADLGVTRSVFGEVLADFCSDVASQLRVTGDGYHLSRHALRAMLDEVSDGALRERLLNHMVVLIGCDGHLSETESILFTRTLEHWQYLDSGEPDVAGSEKHNH